MKKQLIWWLSSILVSVLIVALVTSFQFGRITTYLEDVFYVWPSQEVIIHLAVIIIFSLYINQLVRFLGENKRIALLISILNPIAGLLILFVIYKILKPAWFFKKQFPNIGLPGNYILLIISTVILIWQIFIEIKMLSVIKKYKSSQIVV